MLDVSTLDIIQLSTGSEDCMCVSMPIVTDVAKQLMI